MTKSSYSIPALLVIAACAVALTGCSSKFKGSVELDHVTAQFIEVQSCEDSTPLITCVLRNKKNFKLDMFNTPAVISCYDKSGVKVGAPGSISEIDAGGASKSIMCPANNGVVAIKIKMPGF